MFKAPAVLLVALAAVSPAVEFRLASFNIGALYTSEGPLFGLGDPGTPNFDTVRDIIARIDPDVIALQEIHNVDIDDEVAGTPEDLATLASSLGYAHVYVPPRTSLDFTFRVVFLSKFPFLGQPASIGSPGPANEVTRRFPGARIDVPGTDKDPLIISGHLKSGTATTDRFRRAIELKRIAGYLTSIQATADDNFVILGDFNLSSTNRTFTEPPSGLPSSYALGADVTFPVTYSTNPLSYFPAPAVVRPPLRQVNGVADTYETGGAIDVMLVSPAIAGRPFSSEIYNSTLDAPEAGLLKAGQPLPAGTSATASDHLAIFADIELDLDFPNLDLALNLPAVGEKSIAGSAALTVTLPAARTTSITIDVASDAPSIARPAVASVTIPAGELSASVNLITTPNFITDDGTSVTFSVSAPNYDPNSVVLQVLDEEGPYTFTAGGQTLGEDFTAFDGSHDPAPWITAGTLPWLGRETGGSPLAGFRSYGPASDPSLGLLPDAAEPAPTSFAATFVNRSTVPIQELAISYLARQWRASLDGTADRLSAELLTPTGAVPLPALTYLPATQLSSGPLSPPAETPLATTVTGLAIAPGQAFDLRFTLSPGTGGGSLAAGAFINEFHYDNHSTDADEFVEIALGPGYSGALADLKLYLYNGSGGVSYGSVHALNTFTARATLASGHRLYSKLIPGIQNDMDGLALVQGASVLQFISYEGSFAASNGPAAGMTSVDTTAFQPGNTPAGFYSIRLTGTGANAGDFSWTSSNTANSPGSANTGQTFTSRPQPQGIAIDNLRVTFLPPDRDSDGDGYSDRQETELLLTDPHDPASKFAVTIGQPAAGSVRLEFPTLTGRKYLIQTSSDLQTWFDGETWSGNGNPRTIDFPITPDDPKRFYRIKVAFE